ncbi:MAG: DUF2782 domain-containing protein [Pseudomonadota bacterium]
MNEVHSNSWTTLLLAALTAAPLAVTAQAQDTSGALASETAATEAADPSALEDAPPPPLPPLRSGPRQADPEAEASAEMDDEGVPIPPKARSSDELLPAVRITTGDDGQIVEEYSVNGRVYMVKVTPTKGPAYYLFDVDGDGELDARDFESDNGLRPVNWKILEWE